MIKYLNTAAGHGVTYMCTEMKEANQLKGDLYPGQMLSLNGEKYVIAPEKGLRLADSLVQNDGWSFNPENVAIVDGVVGNDSTASVGSGLYKTIEAAGAAAYTAALADPRQGFAVYVKAIDDVYRFGAASNNGAQFYPEVHYCFEEKAIVVFDSNGSTSFKQIGDKGYGAGNYYIHGKGEFYQDPALTLMVPSFAFTYSSNLYIEAAVIDFFGVVEDITITGYPRAKGVLKVDKFLRTPHLQSRLTKDIGGCNLRFENSDFLGGFKLFAAWQGNSSVEFDRCMFRTGTAYHDPSTGSYDITLKDGTVYATLDLTSTSHNQWSLLDDLASLGSVQAAADTTPAANNRVAAFEIGLDSDSISHSFVLNNCEFIIDEPFGIGLKISTTNANDDADPSYFKLINPRFIDLSGGATAAISAWYSAGTGAATIEVIKPKSGCDTYQQAHTTHPNIVLT